MSLKPMTWFDDFTYLGHDPKRRQKIVDECFALGYIALIDYDSELGWVFHTIFPPDGTVSKKMIAAQFEKREKKSAHSWSEQELESRLVEFLESQGQPCRRQVRCYAGIADIVTPLAVIEVEYYLSRPKMFEAIGQTLAYRQAINPLAQAQIVAMGIDNAARGSAQAALSMGIVISLWDEEKGELCLI